MIDWLRKRQKCITMVAMVVTAILLLLPFFGIELPSKEGSLGCILSTDEIETTIDIESCSALPVTNCVESQTSPVIDVGEFAGYRLQNAIRCDFVDTPFSVYFKI